MKEAMWSVDRVAGCTFSDTTDPSQLTLFTPEPDYVQLQELIASHFTGRGLVPIEEIEEFVLDDTAFRETHCRQKGLGALEKAGRVEVIRPSGRTRSFWNNGTFVTFP
jgi:hypothetical protein